MPHGANGFTGAQDGSCCSMGLAVLGLLQATRSVSQGNKASETAWWAGTHCEWPSIAYPTALSEGDALQPATRARELPPRTTHRELPVMQYTSTFCSALMTLSVEGEAKEEAVWFGCRKRARH